MRPDVIVYEVGPRDGLQNEPETIATERKAELIQRLASAGLARIEITSFVSPKWIPQLADADALCEVVARPPSATYSALVPNEAGYERFRAARLATALAAEDELAACDALSHGARSSPSRCGAVAPRHR